MFFIQCSKCVHLLNSVKVLKDMRAGKIASMYFVLVQLSVTPHGTVCFAFFMTICFGQMTKPELWQLKGNLLYIFVIGMLCCDTVTHVLFSTLFARYEK